MTTTPIYGYRFIASNATEAAKIAAANENALLMEAIDAANALSRTTAAPPGSPDNGVVYIVPDAAASPAPSGAWAGHENEITIYYNGWLFALPVQGPQWWVVDDAEYVHYDATLSPPAWTQSPVVASVGDDNFAKVKLLASLDGTDLATTATDDSDSGHTINFNGNAKLITAQKKFGTASADFDGTGDYLDIPADAEHDFGIFDFTVEFRTRQVAEPGANISYVAKYDLTGDERQWLIQYNSTENRMEGVFSKNGTDFFISSFDMDTDGITVAQFFNSTFHHVAFVRYRDLFLLFVDGKVGGTAQLYDAGIYSNVTIDTIIGARRLGAGVELEMTGQIDEVRITKGLARYTAPFTPPASIFPRS